MSSDTSAAASQREWPISVLALAALAIGLLACLANLLNHHHYPIFKAEVALVALVLLVVAVAAAALHRLAQPRLSFLLTGLYAAVLIDLGADFHTMVFPVLTGVLAFAAWWQERVVLKLTAAAFASVLLFQTFDLVSYSGQPPAPRNEAKQLQDGASRDKRLRPIVHLMLDSYIGLEGMTSVGTDFGDLRQQQEQFYLTSGFQIYPGAYSRHAKTINSLPEFLSYGKAPHATKPRNVQSVVAPPLNYFLDLDRKGYHTSVLTPSFVDLCPRQPLTWCSNYNRSDLSTLDRSDLPPADRARIIGATMLELSQFTNLLAGTISLRIDTWRGTAKRYLHNQDKLYSLAGLRQIDEVTSNLASLQYGEARFIHLLLPHDPYLFDRACKLLPESDWVDEHGPLPYPQRDAAYARQVRCVTQHQIAALLRSLDATSPGRDAIVIIHGDHGSRTFNGEPADVGPLPDQRSFAVAYSAFFAMRLPSQAPGSFEGQYALDELLGGFAATGFARAPRPLVKSAEVYLMNEAWIPTKRISLPPFAQKFPKN